MDKENSEVIEILGVILEKMVKSDVAELKTDSKSLHQEIRYIHQRLDELQKELRNHSGYAKEIDHLLGRVAVIEQHLGITQKAVA